MIAILLSSDLEYLQLLVNSAALTKSSESVKTSTMQHEIYAILSQ